MEFISFSLLKNWAPEKMGLYFAPGKAEISLWVSWPWAPSIYPCHPPTLPAYKLLQSPSFICALRLWLDGKLICLRSGALTMSFVHCPARGVFHFIDPWFRNKIWFDVKCPCCLHKMFVRKSKLPLCHFQISINGHPCQALCKRLGWPRHSLCHQKMQVVTGRMRESRGRSCIDTSLLKARHVIIELVMKNLRSTGERAKADEEWKCQVREREREKDEE